MPWSFVRQLLSDRKRRRAASPAFERRWPNGPAFDPVLAAFERESG